MGLFDRLKGKNKSVEGPVKNKFIELLVLETNHPTTDSIEITFDTADHPGFLQFNPGQYLTVRQTFEKEERRSYSICSSPHEHRLTIAAKRVEKGLVSNWLNDNVVKGFKLEVMPPAGNFYNSSRVNGDSFVLFAGGSGITPIISIIKHTLDSNPSSQIQLVYANRNEESIIFKDELSQLETKFENFSVSHVLSEENKDGYAFGLVDQTFIESNLVDWYDKESNVFLCGPSGFMENVQNSLENLGHNSA
ncbi:MAG: FAD-binding oxidoreductase, partial [Flavobacteriales bacterium]|nr:FAD-binding oxidoreductase [Flavobacteriales bacterium]